MKIPTPSQAVNVIEAMCLYGTGEGQLYRFSHIANKPKCIDTHKDWIKEFWKAHKFLKSIGEVK